MRRRQQWQHCDRRERFGGPLHNVVRDPADVRRLPDHQRQAVHLQNTTKTFVHFISLQCRCRLAVCAIEQARVACQVTVLQQHDIPHYMRVRPLRMLSHAH